MENDLLILKKLKDETKYNKIPVIGKFSKQGLDNVGNFSWGRGQGGKEGKLCSVRHKQTLLWYEQLGVLQKKLC